MRTVTEITVAFISSCAKMQAMNTETIKAKHQATVLAIYVPGERYALSKHNGLSRRTRKALLAAGVTDFNECGNLIQAWSHEVRKQLNVDLRNNPGYKEFC
jgi:hypothetical protein